MGQRFGDLEVLAFIGQGFDGNRLWRCKCLSTLRTNGEPCGNLRAMTTAALNRPGSRRCRQCGQIKLQRARRQHFTNFFKR